MIEAKNTKPCVHGEQRVACSQSTETEELEEAGGLLGIFQPNLICHMQDPTLPRQATGTSKYRVQE